ncbi:sensor domain-containing diguanylate cyclase [Marinomonas foliarum]|jgi:diguanylate cyclase (GGDEF)-like protein|uniref:Sensor domain-containing diguanylate cyclase n=1 Tax=Marinomonas foliarum TaxID=491950 RepID=A0ABX7IQ90_9GAMM|nr:sensor domain-containing diguanylate cyclase [Marinomonas foliarum]QRV24495.1 sensor domain-containing diguanylate cyclase [Marinomonas foliarum]
MIKPDIPKNEAERLHALRALRILDTSHEERFDRITRMAKRMFSVSISLISLIDESRQWFKSRQGLEASETPRDVSFCGHAIHQDGLFIITDASIDERFFDNPLVTDAPNIRFYAGYPLKLRQGINIGTLCIIDSKPRVFDEEDQLLLKDLGTIIEQEIQSIQLATLDELTLISNRRGFMTMVNQMLKACQRDKKTMSFVVFDLNKFKAINDDYGHHEGDFVLAKFAQIMLESFSEYDVIGRLGGDEFVAMLSDRTAEEIAVFLERFAVCVDEVNDSLKKPYRIQYSAGVTHFPHDTDKSIEEMIQCADAAMYQQKKKR